MRYAVLSDIHSNLEALSAVLADAASQSVDRYLCVGDLVGYGADPVACLARLQACGALSVCGNHDRVCFGQVDVSEFNTVARQAVEWTRAQLNSGHLDWLRRLPLVLTDGPLTLVHGTLMHPERFDYLLDLAQAVETVTVCRTPICIVGHTHLPLLFEYDVQRKQAGRMIGEPNELSDIRFTMQPEPMRYVLNPGSVGQPRDGDPKASYLLLDTQDSSVWFRRVAYDVATAQEKIRRAALPEFLAARLAWGR